MIIIHPPTKTVSQRCVGIEAASSHVFFKTRIVDQRPQAQVPGAEAEESGACVLVACLKRKQSRDRSMFDFCIMQSLSILSDVDPADFIRSDAPISQFARSSTGSCDRFPAEAEQHQHQPQLRSNADHGRAFEVGSRPSVLETAQAFGGTSTGLPRQLQHGSGVLASAPQLAAVMPQAPINAGLQISSLQKTSTIKLPSQVLLVFVDGLNGDAVLDRLSNASSASKIPLNTGDRLKTIDGHPCSSASEALASIQSLSRGSSADVVLDFVSRSGASLHVVASRQQVSRARASALAPSLLTVDVIYSAVACVKLVIQNCLI
jgi:hypothetical protein